MTTLFIATIVWMNKKLSLDQHFTGRVKSASSSE